MMKHTFKVRVGVVVFDAAQRLLLARQNQRPFWVLPGGTLEPDETMGDCAVREIAEEAGLEITLGPLLYLADFFTPNGWQVMDVVFWGDLQGGVLTKEMSENLNDIGFYTREEVMAKDLKPDAVFERILASWASGQWDQGVYLGRYA